MSPTLGCKPMRLVSPSHGQRTFPWWWKAARIWPIPCGSRFQPTPSLAARPISATRNGPIIPAVSIASARRDFQRARFSLNNSTATDPVFFITDDGYLISIYHVVKDATKVRLLTGLRRDEVAAATQAGAGLIVPRWFRWMRPSWSSSFSLSGGWGTLKRELQQRHCGDGRFSRHRFAGFFNHETHELHENWKTGSFCVRFRVFGVFRGSSRGSAGAGLLSSSGRESAHYSNWRRWSELTFAATDREVLADGHRPRPTDEDSLCGLVFFAVNPKKPEIAVARESK